MQIQPMLSLGENKNNIKVNPQPLFPPKKTQKPKQWKNPCHHTAWTFVGMLSVIQEFRFYWGKTSLTFENTYVVYGLKYP